MVRALVPLAATAAITTNTTPVLGKINRYNPSAGNLAVALPALSGLDVTANLVVEKDALDSSTNTITVSRAGSDAFDDGSTSVVLSMPGQQVHLQVVQPASTKVWKVIGGYAPLTAAGRALLDDADAAAQRTTLGTLGLVQAAKNPDLLVTGAITVDGNDLITSAAVVWPDGSPGTLTITSRDSSSAVLAYNITYGSPVTKTYTQPTITRNANGAATNVPAIVVI